MHCSGLCPYLGPTAYGNVFLFTPRKVNACINVSYYFLNSEQAADDGGDSENEYSAVNDPVQNKKKMRSEKNRQFRAVAKRNMETTTKVELKKLKDINK